MHYNNWNEGVGGLGAELNMLNTQVRKNSLNIAQIVQSSPDPCHVITSVRTKIASLLFHSSAGERLQICVSGENRSFIKQTCMMIAANNFSPGGSDHDWQKMYNTSTVLDINYWLANAQHFN